MQEKWVPDSLAPLGFRNDIENGFATLGSGITTSDFSAAINRLATTRRVSQIAERALTLPQLAESTLPKSNKAGYIACRMSFRQPRVDQ